MDKVLADDANQPSWMLIHLDKLDVIREMFPQMTHFLPPSRIMAGGWVEVCTKEFYNKRMGKEE